MGVPGGLAFCIVQSKIDKNAMFTSSLGFSKSLWVYIVYPNLSTSFTFSRSLITGSLTFSKIPIEFLHKSRFNPRVLYCEPKSVSGELVSL